MAIRRRVTRDQLQEEVQAARGREARQVARRLLLLGPSIGAQFFPRHQSISVRMAGTAHSDGWLSLFVVSTAGTLYANWLDRWPRFGVPKALVDRYRDEMERLLGPSFVQLPQAYKEGVPLEAVGENWPAFERTVRRVAQAIRSAVAKTLVDAPVGGLALAPEKLSDIEGQVTEVTSMRRGRSRQLCMAARKLSKGRCAACGVDFGAMLGGRGWRVLQVHHRRQLAASEKPVVSTLRDLAVVCANCHTLIHADPKTAMEVEAVAALWRAHRR